MVFAAFVSGLAVGARAAPLTRSQVCGARLSVGVASRASITMSKTSESVPFLPKPKNLHASMVGYAGFDPLSFSDNFDIKWMQESEIKHGRVCMLAFLGMLVQEFVHLPDPAYSNPLATEAFFQVPAGGLWQIFIFCGIAELVLHKGKISYLDMFDDENTKPGFLGFNPMKLTITEKSQLQEIKNGRLAMCGVGGVIHSMLIYKTPIIAQLLDFKPYPLNL